MHLNSVIVNSLDTLRTPLADLGQRSRFTACIYLVCKEFKVATFLYQVFPSPDPFLDNQVSGQFTRTTTSPDPCP